MSQHLSSEATGLLLQLVSTFFGTIMSVCAKVLGDSGLSVFLIIVGSRILVLTAALGALCYQRINPLRSKRKLLLLARGFLGFSVITSIFWSVQLLPLADATVLSRLSPVLIALLAPLLLHEPHSPGVWLALPACLAGVVCMAEPSFLFGGSGSGSGSGGERKARITAGALAVGLSQAVAQAFTRLSVRALGSTEPAASIIASGAAVSAAGGALLCAAVPGQLDVLPSPTGYLLLGLLGLMACGLQASSTVALKLVRVSPAAAVSYLSVVWAMLADYLMFGHAPSPLSLAGAALVCGSTLGLMLWEAQCRPRGPKHSRTSVEESGRRDGAMGTKSLGVGEEDLQGPAEEEQRLLQPPQPGQGRIVASEQQLAERGGAGRAGPEGRSPRRRHGEQGSRQEEEAQGAPLGPGQDRAVQEQWQEDVPSVWDAHSR